MGKFIENVQDFGFQILIAIIIAVVGYVFVKLIISFLKKLLSRTKIDQTAITFIISVSRAILYIFIIIIILSTLGVNVNSIIAAVSAAAITAGLALQDTLSNLASGVIILISKPFVAGDIIEFEGLKGSIVSIKIFTTTINTYDNRTVTIPNSHLTKENLINCTKEEVRRLDLKYTVSYEDDIQKVKDVIMNVISQNEKILSDPQPTVYVGEHLDNGLQILVMLWIEPNDYYPVYYYMQENVKIAFDKNSITIPYPHMLVLKNDK